MQCRENHGPISSFEDPKTPAMHLPERSRFVIYAVGIFVCYFLYGIVQEKLTRGRYGDQVQTDGSVGERFTYALALVWVQCLCNYVFAKCKQLFSP